MQLDKTLVDTIQCAEAYSFLRTLPDNCIHTVITSPPYFGLRSYLPSDDPLKELEVGANQTLDEYVESLVLIFREVRRVLRKDGSLFLNLGDSYNGSGHKEVQINSPKQMTNRGATSQCGTNIKGLKPKDLIGVPWRVAFALQRDGWWLRSAAPWIKANRMPESVTDRLTLSHEYVFHLTKSPDYYFDKYATTLPTQPQSMERAHRAVSSHHKNMVIPGQSPHSMHKARVHGDDYPMPTNRNRRTSDVYLDALDAQIAQLQAIRAAAVVCTDDTVMALNVPTQPSSLAHYAMFPEALIAPLVASGCPEQVCAICAAPYERVTKNTPMKIRRSDWGSKAGNRTATSGTMLERNHSVTLGFAPSCACDRTETDAGITLDPFAGAGTVALVARKLGRHYLGIELSSANTDLARDRLRKPLEARVRPIETFDEDNTPIMQALRGEFHAD